MPQCLSSRNKSYVDVRIPSQAPGRGDQAVGTAHREGQWCLAEAVPRSCPVLSRVMKSEEDPEDGEGLTGDPC